MKYSAAEQRSTASSNRFPTLKLNHLKYCNSSGLIQSKYADDIRFCPCSELWLSAFSVPISAIALLWTISSSLNIQPRSAELYMQNPHRRWRRRTGAERKERRTAWPNAPNFGAQFLRRIYWRGKILVAVTRFVSCNELMESGQGS